MHHSLAPHPDSSLKNLALKADRMVVGVLLLGAAAAIALGKVHGPALSGAMFACGLFLAGVLAWRVAPGSLFSRIMLSIIGMLMVCLHIQLAMGLTELHFGVFVFLAFLLVYRDWRPIVAAAITIALHHVLFDRLQAHGWPVFCMSEPNFGRVLIHAAFVVIQTGVEIVMAKRMRADAQEAQELHVLCKPTQEGELNLDVRPIEVHSTSAIAVREAFLKLEQLVTEARMTANVVQQSSAHIAQSNLELHQHAQQTAEQLQATAALVSHIQNDALTSAKSTETARDLGEQTTENAQHCAKLVTQVVSAMHAINESSHKIGDIVGLIDSIAFQTNILALNAAVEAARAGENGRGFAVVATEVRNLAQRSANAAKDVRSLIQSSLQHAAQGAELVHIAGDSMKSVLTHTSNMAQLIEQLSELAHSQAQSLRQAAAALGNIDTMTQENTHLVAKSSHSAAQLLQQATKLHSVVIGVKTLNTSLKEGPQEYLLAASTKHAPEQPYQPQPAVSMQTIF